MKKCRPVVKEPSGGTLLFRCALPARGASVLVGVGLLIGRLCLGAACTGCIRPARCGNRRRPGFASALPARGASVLPIAASNICSALPRRCLHGVHLVGAVSVSTYTGFASALPARGASPDGRCCGAVWRLCLGATCTGCIRGVCVCVRDTQTLPRRYLHGVHRYRRQGAYPDAYLCLGATCTGCIIAPSAPSAAPRAFASALPARGASQDPDRDPGRKLPLPRRYLHGVHPSTRRRSRTLSPLPRRYLHGVHPYRRWRGWRWRILCLGATCTGCICSGRFAGSTDGALPRRYLHGVHRQKPTNCGTPFCSIRRESVDSFSEINNKDSCADYFPALFCCQGDRHHHYRQPRTDNRPVLRCEQHRLFLFILSSHYRRLL